jgi:hypothetical protein
MINGKLAIFIWRFSGKCLSKGWEIFRSFLKYFLKKFIENFLKIFKFFKTIQNFKLFFKSFPPLAKNIRSILMASL